MSSPASSIRHSLLDALIEEGVVAVDMRAKLTGYSAVQLYCMLLDHEGVDSEKIAAATADYLGLTYVPVSSASVSSSAKELLVRLDAEDPPVIPLDWTAEYVTIGIVDPFDFDIKDRLEALVGTPVQLRLVTRDTVSSLRNKYAGQISRLEHIGDGFRNREHRPGAEAAVSEIDENSAPVVKLLNTLLREAVAKRASDIHVEHQRDNTILRYRIDGVLHPAMEPIAPELHSPLISRVKVMADLDITEHRVPQDGRFQLMIDGTGIDFRVSILPSIDNEDAVIRVLDKRMAPAGLGSLYLESLGFDSTQLHLLRHALDRPSGMVIVTGPTGSGKTTTLYSALTEMASGEVKTVTIEDPVEYRLPGILQIPVYDRKGLTFARGLRSILRHDPDRIMVGEVRDHETAEIAVHSALTGHLLLTTLHANTAVDVLNRLNHLGLKLEQFLPSLSCLVSQRLLRKICGHCRRPTEPSLAELKELGVSQERYVNASWYEAAGCEACNGTGYNGRTVVAEILLLDTELQEFMLENRKHSAITELARTKGFVPLRESALDKAANGLTSLSEIKRVLGAV